MKLTKAVHYAYPTSQRAEELGSPGYYIAHTRLLENGSWSTSFPAQGNDVFESLDDPDLFKLLQETEGTRATHDCQLYTQRGI